MLNEIEFLERLSALWKSGALSDAEFQRKKAELLSILGAGQQSAAPSEEKVFWRRWKLWASVGAVILLLPALLPITSHFASGKKLPSELSAANEFQSDGEPWTAVDKVPAAFQGSYGPERCTLTSQELTDTQQIMHWTGDPPKVLRNFKRIYVSGDRLLVDGSPNSITVYEKSPAGSLVTLKNWFADAKLPADKGPFEDPVCPGTKPNVAHGPEARTPARNSFGRTASMVADQERLQSLGTCVMFQSWFTSSAGLSKLSRISPQLAGTVYERIPKMNQQVNAGTRTLEELMPDIDLRNASAAFTQEMDAAGAQKVISAAQAAIDCTDRIDSELGI